MTDVKERESTINIEESTPRTLVSRALEPVRRVAAHAPLSLRQIIGPDETAVDVDDGTKSYSGIIRLSFILVVLVPMFISGVYFLLWASNQYVAEARFAVRQSDPITGSQTAEQKGGQSESGSSQTLGMSIDLTNQNAEIVANYVKSRAIVDDIAQRLDLRAIFRRPEADFMARLSGDATNEDLVKYWNSMVSVYLESSSGIVTASVSTFRREDSLKVMQAIIASSEALVNSLSVKMRADQEQLAENEVRRSEGKVRFALANLQSFRNSQHLIDPKQSATSNGKLLFQLMGEKIAAEGELYVAERAQGPNAPGMTSLRAKLESVNGQIKDLQDEMAGDKAASKNMAATLSVFEQLELQKEFAKKEFGFAQNGLEAARVSAIRQTIYLAVFVPPSLPQDYTFPNRKTDLFLTTLAVLMLWICGVTISASVLDHRL